MVSLKQSNGATMKTSIKNHFLVIWDKCENDKKGKKSNRKIWLLQEEGEDEQNDRLKMETHDWISLIFKKDGCTEYQFFCKKCKSE